MAAPTTTYQMWKRLADRPGGSRLFSTAAMVRVPYFASIVPHVVRVERGYAEVAMGVLMEATLPTSRLSDFGALTDAEGALARRNHPDRYVPWPSRTRPSPSKVSTSFTSSPRWLR